MADGTLKVGTITTSSGSGTITIGSNDKMTNHMYPAFEAELTANQSVSDATTTKIEFDQKNLDTDDCYDNTTNYRFTPNKPGKYFVYASANLRGSSSNTVTATQLFIHKNGSQIASSVFENQTINVYGQSHRVLKIVDMNGSTDYLEVKGYIDVTSGSPVVRAQNRTIFGAYRIGA